MNRLLALIAFIALAYQGVSQAPLAPVMRGQIDAITVFTDPYTVEATTTDFTSNWNASNVSIGDTIYQENGADLNVYVITGVTTTGAVTFNMTIDDVYDTGNLPQINEIAIIGDIQGYTRVPFVAGISESLQTKIQNHFMHWFAVSGGGVNTNITEGTLNPASAQRTVPMGGQGLVINDALDYRVNASGEYGYGNGAGSNLPPTDSDGASKIQSILDADGNVRLIDRRYFDVLSGPTAPINGDTTAWRVNQLYIHEGTNTRYRATTASTNPDVSAAGSVWEPLPTDVEYVITDQAGSSTPSTFGVKFRYNINNGEFTKWDPILTQWVLVGSGGGSQNLEQTLTIGNDGGQLDYTNVNKGTLDSLIAAFLKADTAEINNMLKLGVGLNTNGFPFNLITLQTSTSLPSGVDGRVLFFRNENITPGPDTLSGAGGETVDGGTYILPHGEAVGLIYDANTTDWKVISSTTTSNTANTVENKYFLGTGQSNMNGADPTGGDKTTNPLVLVHAGGTTWNVWAPTNNNPAFQFAKNYQVATGDTVRVFHLAQNSTAIVQWESGGTEYNNIRTQIAAAGSPQIDGILWHQAESDSGTTDSSYSASLQTVYDEFVAESWFAENRPFVIGGLYNSTTSGDDRNDILRAMATSKERPWWGFAYSEGLSNIPADNVHFSGTALDTLGQRYYEAYKSLPRENQNFEVDEDLNLLFPYWDSSKGLTSQGANVRMGNLAGSLLDLDNAFGNILIGNQAGDGIIDKDGNVIIGELAGDGANPSFSVFLGYRAGRGNSGQYNFSVLDQSGGTAGTGNHNYSIGLQAGNSITSGGNNINFGHQANFANQIGSYNIFLGAQSGLFNLGDSNLGLGRDALRGAGGTVFSNNVGLGNNAGRNITTGANNFLGGPSAGQTITSYLSGVMIGDGAGNGLTTGSGGIGIGLDAASTSVLNASNFVAIGTNAGGDATSLTGSVFVGNSAGQNNSFDEVTIVGNSVEADQDFQAVFGGVNTTQLKSRNYKFDVDQVLDGANDGYVATWDNTQGEITMKPPSSEGIAKYTDDNGTTVTPNVSLSTGDVVFDRKTGTRQVADATPTLQAVSVGNGLSTLLQYAVTNDSLTGWDASEYNRAQLSINVGGDAHIPNPTDVPSQADSEIFAVVVLETAFASHKVTFGDDFVFEDGSQFVAIDSIRPETTTTYLFRLGASGGVSKLISLRDKNPSLSPVISKSFTVYPGNQPWSGNSTGSAKTDSINFFYASPELTGYNLTNVHYRALEGGSGTGSVDIQLTISGGITASAANNTWAVGDTQKTSTVTSTTMTGDEVFMAQYPFDHTMTTLPKGLEVTLVFEK